MEHQKNSRTTKTVRPKHKSLAIWWFRYGLILLIASYIFYKRFPNNYLHPNFYAEDGSVLAKNIIDKGFFNSLLTTFNGYYIWGLYILEKIGMVINFSFFNNEFANLPRALALTSYFYLAFLVTLPILLFKNYFKPKATTLIVLLALFVPMTSYDYAIIGTIGNLKFSFIYFAFLLLVYRHLMPENSKKVYLVDAGLLICAYTNITVYPLMLFALLRYLPKFKGKQLFKKLLVDRTFKSLVGLGLLLLPQLYVVKTQGVPVLKGYLDSGYDYKRTIEIFVDRSYIYSLVFPVNKFLNDVWSILITGTVVIAGIILAKKYRRIFLFGLASIFIATFLFVLKRTGVSELYLGYKSSGPDQFFYPQNWIFTFIISLVAVEVLDRINNAPWRKLFYILVFAVIIFGLAPKASNYDNNDFMNQNVGTIYAVGKIACDTNKSEFNISIYPSPENQYNNVSRKQLCTNSVTDYHPKEYSLGLLPFDNQYIDVSATDFQQTFTSPYNNLDGLNIYFSTFVRKVDSPYSMIIYKADCVTLIQTTDIPVGKLKDNAFYAVKTKVIEQSKDVEFCFSIKTKASQPEPLALQLSKPGAYPGGQTFINEQPSNRDVVFALHYK